MTVVEDPRLGSRGSARIPSAGDVLIAAIGLVLTGAGLPEAVTLLNGHAAGTGFVAARVVGAAHPRAAVTWYEDGKPTGGPDGPAGKLHGCEQALRRAGFHVEYTAANTGGYCSSGKAAVLRPTFREPYDVGKLPSSRDFDRRTS
jgi:hypothetical protein